uniref:Uncharacterized protein n=1 Tax=Rhizophora mucronata TaxID=61149 RepID=A0A2P2LRB1_RHIMU
MGLGRRANQVMVRKLFLLLSFSILFHSTVHYLMSICI